MPRMPHRICGSLLVIATVLGLTSLEAVALSVESGLAFTGRIAAPGLGAPPDTTGSVGEQHVVELLNGGFSVYHKQDGTLLKRTNSLDDFWQSAGVTPIGGSFDPRMLYDASSQRWFAVSVDGSGLGPTGGPSANRFLVGVSQTSDPTLGWSGFAIDSDSTDVSWADFPQVGLDDDALYIAAGLLPVTTGALSSALVVLPKADLLAPTPTVAGATSFQRVALGTSGISPTPVVNLDGGGLPARVYSGRVTPFGQIQSSGIDGPLAAPTYTGGGLIAIAPMPEPPYARQPGPKPDLDTGGNGIFRSGAVRRNGIDWTVQSVDVDGRAAVRWIQIDPENDIVLDSGVIADPVLDLFYPSIAVNELDEIVIGMSGSSETDFAGAYAIAGARVAGVTMFGDLMLLEPGHADYQRINGNPPRNRWGDYSATVVDPANPHHFWTFQEYVHHEDNQAIWIAELILVPEPATLLSTMLGLLCLAWPRASERRSRG